MRKDFQNLPKQQTDGMGSSEKKHTIKAGYVAYRTIQVAILIYFIYELYLHITTGRPISNLLVYFLLLAAPAKIYKNIEDRNAHKNNSEELKQHDMIVYNTAYGFMCWSAYFVLCFWRLRLKISRIGA